MDPNMIRDVLFKYNIFQKSLSSPLTSLLVSGTAFHEGQKWAKSRKIINPAFTLEKLKNSLSSPLIILLVSRTVSHEGQKWTKYKKIITPAFTLEKLKHMLPTMYMNCNEIISEWDVLVPIKGSCEIDVWPYLGNLTGDVISRTAFGSSYEEGRRIFQLQKEQAQLTSQQLQSNYIPGWRQKAMKVEDDKNGDLLGMLLESNLKEIEEQGNKRGIGITVEDKIEEWKLFYFARQETTTTLLVWTMVMLGKHQDWQAHAREEALQAFLKNKPDLDRLNC
ncbi:unnamed protein product [Ilex paraguariensis]|uniref:Cytochrome P450 n=1 Tax=Ilex paraguariensis TaxID=185542 RepID=A0ABC8R7P4_9AQUA